MNNNILDITLHEKVGQLFCPAAYINDTAENIKEIENLILNHNVGGLTFFHSRTSAATNFEGKKNVVRNENSAQRLSELIQHYQKLSKFPLLISIDAEWGLAMRVENTPQYPYAITLGALSECDNNLVFEVAKNIGLDLKQLGINYNLAPVVDINDNPKNPVIGYRSFGTDANNVTLKAIAFCNGLQQTGVLSCLKHFPGHGNTAVDSHLGLPIINKTKAELENIELYPFAKIIQNNIVDSVMIGHLAVPALTNGTIVSATLSSEIIQNILRKQFKFNGLVISDALNMHSVSKLYSTKGVLEWKAFEAGNDFLCFSENVADGIEQIMQNASLNKINESYERVKNLKNKIFKGKNVPDPFNYNFIKNFEKAAILNKQIADKVVVISKNDSGLLPLQDHKKVLIINVYNSCNSVFCNQFNHRSNTEFIDIEFNSNFDNNALVNNLQNYDIVLVAFFVPSVKPLNNFEIEQSILNLLEILFNNPKVAVCLFGNPYALDTVPNSTNLKTLIYSYQHFDAFQIATANVLMGI